MNERFEEFKKFWEYEIAKIEREALDAKATRLIHSKFKLDRHLLEITMTEDEFENRWFELEKLESKLIRSLEVARSRFTLKNRGLFAKIFSGIIMYILSLKHEIEKSIFCRK